MLSLVGAWIGVQRRGQERQSHHGAAAGAVRRGGVDRTDVGSVRGGVDHSGGIVGIGDTYEAVCAAFEFGIMLRVFLLIGRRPTRTGIRTAPGRPG